MNETLVRKRKIYAIYAYNNVQNNSDIERKIERRSFFTEQEREFTILKKIERERERRSKFPSERWARAHQNFWAH